MRIIDQVAYNNGSLHTAHHCYINDRSYVYIYIYIFAYCWFCHVIIMPCEVCVCLPVSKV